MEYRTEKDCLGEMKVPKDALYGAQTERSRRNFKIGAGKENMPAEIIYALAVIKKAAAIVNAELSPLKITEEKKDAIVKAADEILSGKLDKEFPLVVFQTGSGTQTNLNVNEVIANVGNGILGRKLLHPNDDVNLSQSSNDVFPSAVHIAILNETNKKFIPAVKELINALKEKEKEFPDIIKCGRTHYMDATPVKFSQELSGFSFALSRDLEFIEETLKKLLSIALGGTAVGTGLNAPETFDLKCAKEIEKITGLKVRPSENKFCALWSRGDIAFFHGALKALATDLYKIACDIRFLSSGPRCGIGEITLPANEPGSSIMPGKVNPTQCEAVTMVCAEVFGNDQTVSFAASQGNLELNVFAPVIAYDVLQSIRLLSECMESFTRNCVVGIKANREKMKSYLDNSLMLVTALSKTIGYDAAAKIAFTAQREGISLKDACVKLKVMTEKEYEKAVDPEKMV
ncbi:MAG: class II fumarate hydratase [Clostridia bacterium]|nr:class II fumarate hydratase [Clostridia bacterium]